MSIEPLVAVTTFARKAFCLAANSGSRDRDDLFEVEPVVVEFVVLLLLWKKAILYYNGPPAQLYFNGPGFFQQKPAVHWKCQNSIGDKWAIEV